MRDESDDADGGAPRAARTTATVGPQPGTGPPAEAGVIVRVPPSRPDPAADHPTRRWWIRPLILVTLLTAGAVVALTVDIPSVDDLRAAVSEAGWMGPTLYAALYAGLTLTPAPATVLSIGAGLLFGVPEGIAVVMAGALVGAATAFGLARALGRQAMARVDSRALRRLDGLLHRHGLLAVIGIRLVPVLPFGPSNYACGLTDIGARDYLLGTAVGILPPALAFVTIGAYGVRPASTPFLVALGALALLALAAVVAGRRRAARRSPTSSPTAAPR